MAAIRSAAQGQEKGGSQASKGQEQAASLPGAFVK